MTGSLQDDAWSRGLRKKTPIPADEESAGCAWNAVGILHLKKLCNDLKVE